MAEDRPHEGHRSGDRRSDRPGGASDRGRGRSGGSRWGRDETRSDSRRGSAGGGRGSSDRRRGPGRFEDRGDRPRQDRRDERFGRDRRRDDRPRQDRDRQDRDRRGPASRRGGEYRGGSRPQSWQDRRGEDADRNPRGQFERRREQRQEDVRSGYRPSRGRAPEIDEEVTGRELDKSVQRELRVLEPDNAEVVSRHLVMTSLYLDVDPDFALEHAQAAVARAGRVAAVREAAGVAAYAAEDWETALRELRTHRRMTGSHEHLPLIVDAQRALGRTAKALEEARDDEALEGLTAEQKAELAMVVSGIHQDAGDLEAARRALEIPELNPRRAFSYSPRLYSAYAEVLEAQGREAEAARWSRLSAVAEAALGQGQFAEPEIYDIDVLPDEQPEEEEGIEMAEQEPTPEEMEEVAAQRRRAEAEAADDERLAAVAEDRTGLGGALDEVEPEVERTGEEELRTELGDVVEKTELEDEDPGDPEATDETEIEGDVVTEDVADDDAATTGGMPPELREVEEDIARDNAGDAGRA